jgi:hypothetical protein
VQLPCRAAPSTYRPPLPPRAPPSPPRPPGVVDAVLIPEVQFKLEGPTGLLAYIEKVLENKGHAVICIAEGAGQVGAPWRRTN